MDPDPDPKPSEITPFFDVFCSCFHPFSDLDMDPEPSSYGSGSGKSSGSLRIRIHNTGEKDKCQHCDRPTIQYTGSGSNEELCGTVICFLKFFFITFYFWEVGILDWVPVPQNICWFFFKLHR
jgi:hypothetical protein